MAWAWRRRATPWTRSCTTTTRAWSSRRSTRLGKRIGTRPRSRSGADSFFRFDRSPRSVWLLVEWLRLGRAPLSFRLRVPVAAPGAGLLALSGSVSSGRAGGRAPRSEGSSSRGTQINNTDLQLPDQTQIPASSWSRRTEAVLHTPKALLFGNGLDPAPAHRGSALQPQRHLLLLERRRDAPGCEEPSLAGRDQRVITAVSALICVLNDMEPCAVRSPAAGAAFDDSEPCRDRSPAEVEYRGHGAVRAEEPCRGAPSDDAGNESV